VILTNTFIYQCFTKTFRKGKREETFRRATEEDPSPGWREELMSCDQMNSVTDLHNMHLSIQERDPPLLLS